jgi:hypothetical protein
MGEEAGVRGPGSELKRARTSIPSRPGRQRVRPWRLALRVQLMNPSLPRRPAKPSAVAAPRVGGERSPSVARGPGAVLAQDPRRRPDAACWQADSRRPKRNQVKVRDPDHRAFAVPARGIIWLRKRNRGPGGTPNVERLDDRGRSVLKRGVAALPASRRGSFRRASCVSRMLPPDPA